MTTRGRSKNKTADRPPKVRRIHPAVANVDSGSEHDASPAAILEGGLSHGASLSVTEGPTFLARPAHTASLVRVRATQHRGLVLTDRKADFARGYAWLSLISPRL